MQRQTQLEILAELLRQLDNSVNIDAGVQYRNPAQSYTCPELAWQRPMRSFVTIHR